MKTVGIFFAVLILLVCGSRGYGVDYYVSKSGSDSSPGSEAQPWKTIQKAANTLTAGDTVYIKAGTYNERVILQNSGSAGNYITYAAYGNDTVAIDGSGITLPQWWGGLLDISNRSYIRVSGLQIKNAGPDDNNCGILIDYSSYIIIEDCYTYNTTSSGIGVWDSTNITLDNNEVELACNDGEQECISIAITDNFTVSSNHVHNGGPGSIGGEGICLKDGSSNGKVYGNRVHDLNRLGIYMDAWDKHTYNIEVYRNVVYNCSDADGFTFASESGGLLENISVYNNIAYNNGVCGLTVSSNGDAAKHPMKDIFVINNTFYNNGSGGWGGGIAIDNAGIQSLTVRNNIVSQNRDFQIEMENIVPAGTVTVEYNLIHGYRYYGEEIRGNHYVEGDPLFVNASAADFRLQSGSSAIDRGTATGAPSSDYAGASRPLGAGYDIGAYEYGSAPVVLEPEPFGSLDTPVHGSTVRSSIPVTGWALDDVAITSLKIYRNAVSGESGSMTYIGDAAFVEGARPDVETAYPGYPNNSKAGWGYMMLTNFLPNSGNGTFTIYAVASDGDGNQVTLGSKTIVCDNANAVKPFGAIDTPLQGGAASGASFINWGWVLTPQPNSIPTDGSTINVYVDGVDIGHPTYNIYRADIAGFFPGYANSSGAVGYFYLDTTTYGNGVHNIYWTATDSGGNTDGIGSRYFTINNSSGRSRQASERIADKRIGRKIPASIVTGTVTRLETRELERIEIKTEPGVVAGYMLVGERLKPLPIGSTLDRATGVFYWGPGPGFRGNYRLLFIKRTPTGEYRSRTVSVTIHPRYDTAY